MSSIKVSALTAKTTPSGSEELLINDGGTSKKITIANLPDTDTTYSNFAGTTAGLVPTSTTGDDTKFLRADGTWVVPTDTDTNTNQLTTFTVSATTDTTPTTISQGDDLMFTAGTGITCETTADGTVTITNTVTDTDTVYTHPTGAGNEHLPSSVSQTEAGYLDGVTSNIQTQLGTKLPLAGGTMTGTIAGFTSTGIDDNATSTAITIDASENVTLDGWVATNGEWYKLNDAGATIGGIYRSGAVLGTSATDLSVFTEAGKVIHFSVNGVAAPVATVTSNGLTFNGDTAAANALDDYEEGTWTPTFLNTTVSAGPSQTTGRYTKIGNTVHVNYYGSGLTFATTGSMIFGGLPFTVASAASYSTFHYLHGTASSSTTTGGYFVSSNTQMYTVIQGSTASAQWAVGGPKYLMISGTYIVA